MGKLGFGELELSILKAVRALKRATVRDVYKNLGSAGSYTTIMTVMSRLAEKGELLREKNGTHYVYWAAMQNPSSSKNIFKRIQDKIFGGNKVAMVSYLLESDEMISEADLEAIENLLQKRRLEQKKNG